MTINVQATRQSTKAAVPGHEDYQEKEDRGRRFVPLIFLLIVGSFSAYLKSFLPATLDASEARGAPRGSGAEEETLREEALATAEEPRPGEEPAPAEASGRSDKVRISAPTDEQPGSSGATDFSARARTDKPMLDRGSGESLKIANDNRPLPRQENPSLGGAGGGGGGGGGGDDRRPNPRAEREPPSPDHRNRAPRVSGAVHLPDAVACNGLAISLAALLAGTIDPDGDTLTVVGIYSSSGTLTPIEDGWEFDRDQGMLGEVKLTYAISDGTHVVMQTAYFNVVEAPPITGTDADENLLGTQCAETIVALGGADNIDARGGDDRISGGAGDDHILAGAGHDVVYAGDGNDIVFAGAGDDVVFGGAGNDRLFGEDGDDTLMGEAGNDHLDGGAGRDILLSGAGNDTLDGGAGNDTLDGGGGADRIAGGAGNDILSDGAGPDQVRGGDGDDHLLASADAADDNFSGGTGSDMLDYSAASSPMAVNLAAGRAVGADIGDDAISDIEAVIGGGANDELTAGAIAASIDGGGGDDVVTGGAGNDTLKGGAGTDTLSYASATSAVTVNLAAQRASGAGIGADHIAEFEIVIGGASDDGLTGGAGDDVLAGGAGNDTIADGAGSDKVEGGCGDDVVLASVDGADDQYEGNSGNDVLDYSETTITVTIDLRNGTAQGVEIGKDLIDGFEEIIAGSGNDLIYAGNGPVVLTGGAGDDCFTFQCDDDGVSELNTLKKITDFTVGDKIVAATYQITIKDGDNAEEKVADLFEQIYLDEKDGSQQNRPVRFRFEELADSKYTAIDVARSDDGDVMTIEVAGHHNLQFTPLHF